jgi:eukaryotic-like serine/threonine-protein kinase
VVAVMGGAGTAVWQAREARLQRDAALVEKQRAEEVKAFVLGIFRDANPQQSGAGRALSAVDLLTLATERVARIDGARVELRAELLGTLAHSLHILGQSQQAETLLRKGYAEAAAGLGPEHRLALWNKGMLAQTLRAQGRHAEMKAVLDELIPALRGRQDEMAQEFMNTLVTVANLACMQYRIDDCRRAVSEGLTVADKHFGGRHASAMLLLTTQARLQSMAGDGAAAVASARRGVAIALDMNKNNPAHATVLNARHGLAAMLAESGQYAEGASEFDAVLADTARALGPGSRPQILRQIEAAPWVAVAGEPARGMALTTEALALLDAMHSPDDHARAFALTSRAQIELSSGDGEGAWKDLVRAIDITERIGDKDSPPWRTMRHDLAWALALLGRHAEALATLGSTPDLNLNQNPDLASRARLARAHALHLAGKGGEAAAALDRMADDLRAAGFRLQPLPAAQMAALRKRLPGAPGPT